MEILDLKTNLLKHSIRQKQTDFILPAFFAHTRLTFGAQTILQIKLFFQKGNLL